jgi:uncharacterized membrane protein YgcG
MGESQQPKRAQHSVWRRVLFVALVSLLAAACTSFDPLNQTGEQVNRAQTDYANDATLLNVVRASLSESPTFVAITGLDGTASASGTLGFGGATLGPHVHTSPHTFLLGADSFMRSNSNTVHMSVVDDPASFVALSSPVNPAVIAFFIRQGFPPAMLFFMLVDEIDEMEVGKDGKPTGAVLHKYFNRRLDPTYGDFLSVMATLLNEGLTAQLDVTAVPSGRALPSSRLCIDPSGPRPGFGSKFAGPPPATNNPALCANAPWIEGRSAGGSGGSSAGSGGSSGSSSGAGSITGLGVARDGSLWAEVGGQAKIVHISPSGKVTPVTFPADLLKPKVPAYTIAYDVADLENRHYQLFLRSTYGAYAYAGDTMAPGHRVENLLEPDASGSGALTNIIIGGGSDCFAEVEYRGIDYCVRNKADNTKRVFALLHQLQELETAPSNVPTTLTVTPTIP